MKKFECNGCKNHCVVTTNDDCCPVICHLVYEDWHEVKEESAENESPEKALLYWVKKGAIGYNHKQQWYFEVTKVTGVWVDIKYLDTGRGATYSYPEIWECSEAKKRPFYDKEMQKLVGRIFTNAAGDVSIATDFDGQTNTLYIRGAWFNRKVLADSAWLLDGKPCYVLEHLVDGEWVR